MVWLKAMFTVAWGNAPGTRIHRPNGLAEGHAHRSPRTLVMSVLVVANVFFRSIPGLPHQGEVGLRPTCVACGPVLGRCPRL